MARLIDETPNQYLGRSLIEWTEILEWGSAVDRVAAAWMLGELGSRARAVLPAVASSIKDEDPDVRRTVAWALGRISPATETCLSALFFALDDPCKEVRFEAVWSLKRYGPQAAKLISQMADEEAATINELINIMVAHSRLSLEHRTTMLGSLYQKGSS